jgi:hypothetical protein
VKLLKILGFFVREKKVTVSLIFDRIADTHAPNPQGCRGFGASPNAGESELARFSVFHLLEIYRK